jgi:site-specific recombinase XerD
MSHHLHLSKVRAKLIASGPQREPFWDVPSTRGRNLGLRVNRTTEPTWIARLRVADVEGKVRHEYESLGNLTETFGYDEALAAAEEWFKRRQAEIEGGGASVVATVADACRAYLAELRAGQRTKTADDAERQFERTVFGREKGSRRKAIRPNAIATIPLPKLTVADLKKWRNGLSAKDLSTANRKLTDLKAALNLAVTNNPALATKGLEWSAVVPHEIKDDRRRKLVLHLKERRALVAAAKGALRDLISAVSLIGARAGELTGATVSQFNARAHELTLTGKTGTRTIKLSSAACALFKRLSTGKAPNDRLLLREDGRPWAHSDWDQLVKEAAKAAKLSPQTCLYTLRHSWITDQIAGGMTTLDVARLAGTSLMMIEHHYGKTSKDVKQRLDKVAML